MFQFLFQKKLRPVLKTAMAASLPISSQLGATAVASTSAPSNSSSETATPLPKRILASMADRPLAGLTNDEQIDHQSYQCHSNHQCRNDLQRILILIVMFFAISSIVFFHKGHEVIIQRTQEVMSLFLPSCTLWLN